MKTWLGGTHIYGPVEREAAEGSEILGIENPDFGIIVCCHDPYFTTALKQWLVIRLLFVCYCKYNSDAYTESW